MLTHMLNQRVKANIEILQKNNILFCEIATGNPN